MAAVYYKTTGTAAGSPVYFCNEQKDSSYYRWLPNPPYVCNNMKAVIELVDGKFILPKNCNYMFYGALNSTFDFTGIDTSEVEGFKYMFKDCRQLEQIDLSTWDFSKVKSFNYMFENCTELRSIDLSGHDYSSAESLQGMFSGCTRLTTINTDNMYNFHPTNLNSIFKNCINVTDFGNGITNWDISNVTDFTSMFYGCYGLTSLDISKWEFKWETDSSTQVIVDMMFGYCAGLETIYTEVETDWSIYPNIKSYLLFDECVRIRNWSGYADISKANTSSTGYFTGKRNIYQIYEKIGNDWKGVQAYVKDTTWQNTEVYM